MGILDFLHKEELNPEQIWDEYASSYYKKGDLAKEIISLSEWFQRTKKPDILQKIIDTAIEIEKLVPKELVEISEEEKDIERINKEYEKLKEMHEKTAVINQIMENHRDLVDNYNELIPHMKEALENLSAVLKQELAFISLIKKDASKHDNIKKLVALIFSNESLLTRIFGRDAKIEVLFEGIVLSALTNTPIIFTRIEKEEITMGEIKKKEREFRFDYPKERRTIKNNLDNITVFFNQKLTEWGENDFEVFYTQTHDGKSPPYAPLYGVFIRFKNNKRRDYVIMGADYTYLNKRIKKEKIINEYNLEYIARTKLRTGIDVLRAVSK